MATTDDADPKENSGLGWGIPQGQVLHLYLSAVQLFRDNVNPFLLDQAGTDKVPKAA